MSPLMLIIFASLGAAGCEQTVVELARVQSHWSDEIYSIWHRRNVQANGGIRNLAKD